VILLRYAESNFGGNREKPVAHFRKRSARETLTLLTAPRGPGPVKRSSHYFSTAADDRVWESGGLAARKSMGHYFGGLRPGDSSRGELMLLDEHVGVTHGPLALGARFL
jgi:hypothetical protein